jgi:hypothetical protein
VLTGLAAVWRGPRWPVMSARFQRQGQQRPDLSRHDSATMWESLSQDIDPTVAEERETRTGQVDGGART